MYNNKFRHRLKDFNILQECNEYAKKYYDMAYNSLGDEDKNKIYLDVSLLRKH